MSIDNDVMRMIEPLIGQLCVRQAVGRMKSLSLGFGEKAEPASAATEKQYRAWEIGTFGNSAWRITKDGVLLMGSLDSADSIDESNVVLSRISLGRFSALKQPSVLDVRVEFDSGMAVDFLSASGEEDENFHIFCPGAMYVEFSALGGWDIGPSNEPWAPTSVEAQIDGEV
jgi:hypothetical protein